MSTEAWERAVEAGARAMAEGAGEAWHLLSVVEQHRWKLRAGHSLRAAFPILAEEFMAALEDEFDPEYPEHSKHVIRARIEQMKEIRE